MKENDGKAARKRRLQQWLMVAAVLALTGSSVYLLVVVRRDQSSTADVGMLESQSSGRRPRRAVAVAPRQRRRESPSRDGEKEEEAEETLEGEGDGDDAGSEESGDDEQEEEEEGNDDAENDEEDGDSDNTDEQAQEPLKAQRRRQLGRQKRREKRRRSSALDDETPTNDQSWDDILSGRSTLVELQVDDIDGVVDERYAGFTAVFCTVDWELHKRDPAAVPMFRDVLEHSKGCQPAERVKVPLHLALQRIRAHDARRTKHSASSSASLPLSAMVFHESRCGSTLVANLLSTFDSAQNRVYSESGPPVTVFLLACGGRDPSAGFSRNDRCTQPGYVQLLQDVIFLMGRRTEDSPETRLFFKIQSAGTVGLPLFQKAFPQTPWLFVYRDPVAVMVSHLRIPNPYNANCVRRERYSPSPAVRSILTYHGFIKAAAVSRNAAPLSNSVSPYHICAAHLASICESALQAFPNPKANRHHQESTTAASLGRAINYHSLPEILWEQVLPSWQIPVDDKALQKMKDTAGQYSKGRADKRENSMPINKPKKQRQQ